MPTRVTEVAPGAFFVVEASSFNATVERYDHRLATQTLLADADESPGNESGAVSDTPDGLKT